MNFVGHIAVATRLGPAQQLINLGAALPDLATIGRFRLTSEPSNDMIASGVELHHRTDDAFHGHEWFIGFNTRIRESLERAGLNRGATLACGHVGTELLLDGYLLGAEPGLRSATESALDGATRDDIGLLDLVDDPHRQRWATHLGRIADWTLPSDYDDPAGVAKRLHRIVSDRPRLAFDTDAIDTVADSLASVQAELKETAEDALVEICRTAAAA